jgi:parvulin-like peptidyl-prolyl isomerase
LPKESENAEGQVYPSWDEFKEKFINPLKKISPKPAEKNIDNIVTFDDLSDEQRQGYEVLRKKRREEFEAMKKKLMKKYEEEDLQEFLASLKKDHQDNVTQVGEIKSPSPCSDLVELC